MERPISDYLNSGDREVYTTSTKENHYYVDENGRKHTKTIETTTIRFLDHGRVMPVTDRSPEVAAPMGGSEKDPGDSGFWLRKRHGHLDECGFSDRSRGSSTTSLSSSDSGCRCKDDYEPLYKDSIRLYSKIGEGWLRVTKDHLSDIYYLDTKGRKSDPNGRFIWANDSQGRGMALAVALPSDSEPAYRCISYNKDHSLKLVPCTLAKLQAIIHDESCIFESVITPDCAHRKIARFRAKYGPEVAQHDLYLGATGPDDCAKLCEQYVSKDSSPSGTDPETCFVMTNCA